MKLKHQLADGAVNESEVDKYRNESCEDMNKTLEIAQPAPAAKTGDECEVKMPQKIRQLRVRRLLQNLLGRARLAYVTSCNTTVVRRCLFLCGD